MTSYVVIDFETANQGRDSACAVGVVRVDAGQITEEWDTLIDPEAKFFWANTKVHGLRQSDVAGAPKFPEVLERILTSAAGAERIVAHNAAFDVSVLIASAKRYGLTLNPVPSACTLQFARRWWPGWSSYNLNHLVQQLGLGEQLGAGQHHEALWDARACAAIAARGFADAGVGNWSEAADVLGLDLDGGVVAPPNGAHVEASTATGAPSAPGATDRSRPLAGRQVCFTGTLIFKRAEAAQAVIAAGGSCSANVTSTTDYLVVGRHDLARIGADGTSSKMRRAVELARKGYPVEVIGEGDFLRLVDMGGAALSPG